MSKCLDCGCTMEGGICSNCHEELFIQTYQSEYIEHPLSKEFTDQANDQAQSIRRRNKIIREDPAVFRDLNPNDNYYKETS